jgi:hypothetical protein
MGTLWSIDCSTCDRFLNCQDKGPGSGLAKSVHVGFDTDLNAVHFEVLVKACNRVLHFYCKNAAR